MFRSFPWLPFLTTRGEGDPFHYNDLGGARVRVVGEVSDGVKRRRRRGRKPIPISNCTVTLQLLRYFVFNPATTLVNIPRFGAI